MGEFMTLGQIWTRRKRIGRLEKLFEKGAVSQQEVDNARFARDMAMGKLKSAEAPTAALFKLRARGHYAAGRLRREAFIIRKLLRQDSDPSSCRGFTRCL